MSVSHQYLFNRILDITAIIHVPIKVLSIVIVIRYSPPHMRLLSFFLLNGLVWNFAANLVFTVMHVYPMYPAECFRTDGIVSFIDNEIFSHAIFGLLFVFILNTVIAVTSTFIYRYIIFVFPNQIEFIKRRLLLSTFALHIGVTIATAVLYTKWALLKESYPDKDELPLGNSVLCLNPYGPQKDGALWTFIGGIAVATFVCLASAFLLLVSIYRKRGIVHKKSLDNHKKVLQILVTVSSIPLLFAAVPITIAVATSLNPKMSHAEAICLVCIVLLSNHGTFYSIALILVIKPYRKGAYSLLLSMVCRKRNDLQHVVPTKSVFSVRYNE
ncbi:hypothetical protein QR680_016299 [Steinernema hermaphroditum]|uniref:Uncharacterized protein n=1 Tax=Steinernema hermaphroditum TaxID=289476 RepID=A0AA39HAR6_9BILA|nr:hypothetical protein QR680_016299 [Steinernema hermaphroditum]